MTKSFHEQKNIINVPTDKPIEKTKKVEK